MSIIIHPLEKGDAIGIMAPSSYVSKKDLKTGIALIEKMGYKVIVHPQTYAKHNQSAGTDDEKISALHELWRNPEVKVIMAAGGGNRALHLLDRLDYWMIDRNPKFLVGFSDITAILNAIYAKTRMTGIHGTVLKKLADCKQAKELFDILSGKEISLPTNNIKVLKEGVASGRMFGGNLSVFQCLPGTRHFPKISGEILFLEEWNEEISHVDRMFLHLRQTGVLEKISGLILGEFALKDSGRPYGFTLEKIVEEHTKDLKIPIIAGAPFGHGKEMWPLPVGGVGNLKASLSGNSDCVLRVRSDTLINQASANDTGTKVSSAH